MSDATKVTIAGKEYWRQMCRVDRPVYLDTERGVAVVLGVTYGAASQCFQACFSATHQAGLAAAMRLYLDLRAYPKGWAGYALLEGRTPFSGFIRGFEPLEVDDGKRWLADEAVESIDGRAREAQP